MKALVLEELGDPAQVLKLRDMPTPEPGRGEVRVRMLVAPINPSDVMFVRGVYGRRPQLPATPGFEGVGIVETAGPGLLGKIRVGKRVAVLHGKGGTWQEQTVVPARQVVPVPSALADEQAACFFVNPASALLMTKGVLRVRPGSWLLQTAAGSALGRMVIRLGKHYGFKTINVIRRREQVEELMALGADAVICTQDESIEDRVRALTKGEGVPYAIDAVGGSMGTGALKSLGNHGRLLLYGTLAFEPIEIDPRVLLVGQKKVEGFWLSEWVRDHGVVSMVQLFRKLGRLLANGVIATEVGKMFPLEQAADAVRLADQAGKQGKVLFRIGTK